MEAGRLMDRADRDELLRDLEDARTASEILCALARSEFANAHNGAVCPAECFPGPETMVESLMEYPSGPHQDEANELLSELLGFPARWGSEWPTLLYARSKPLHQPGEAVSIGEAAGVQFPEEYEPDDVVKGLVPCIWVAESRDGGNVSGLEIPLTHVYLLWLRARAAALAAGKQPQRCPFAPLVEQWQRRKLPSSGLAQHFELILARSVGYVEQNAPAYFLARFQPAAHRMASGQLLFGFEDEGERGPTLPANVWALGLDSKQSGAVVSLALRIWVACILHTPLEARHGSYPVEIGRQGDDPLTLRKFLAWLYPGKRMPRPNEYWSRIMDARDVVHAAEVIYADASGVLWGRQVVRLDTPVTRPPLDHRWPVVTHFPPGDGTGPRIVFERLQYWSVRDPAAYRALINLAYRWHVEGKRLMPVKGGNHWLRLRDPKVYDRMTDADATAICYPPGFGTARVAQRIKDAYATLEKLVKAGDAVSVEGRLLPPLSSDGTGAWSDGTGAWSDGTGALTPKRTV